MYTGDYESYRFVEADGKRVARTMFVGEQEAIFNQAFIDNDTHKLPTTDDEASDESQGDKAVAWVRSVGPVIVAAGFYWRYWQIGSREFGPPQGPFDTREEAEDDFRKHWGSREGVNHEE